MKYWKINFKAEPKNRNQAVLKYELTETLLDLLVSKGKSETVLYTDVYNEWKKVWALISMEPLTDNEIDSVCEDEFLDQKYFHANQIIKSA